MLTLFRYFSKTDAHAFVERGEVLFHSLSYFPDYEDQGVRADENEGKLVHLPFDGLRINLVNSGESVLLPHRMESKAKEDDIFVYCLSTELSNNIAERFKAEAVIEIFEPIRFLAKVRSALALRSRIRAEKLVHQPVQYYEWCDPPIVDWALPERIAVRKPKSFEWQKEYRLVVPVGDAFQVGNVNVELVPPDAAKPLRKTSHPQMLLKLGSLSKICRVHYL